MSKKDINPNQAEVALKAWAQEENKKSKAIYFLFAQAAMVFVILTIMHLVVACILIPLLVITALRAPTYLKLETLPPMATDEMLAWLADWPMDDSIKSGIAQILQRDGAVSTAAILHQGDVFKDRHNRELREQGKGFNKMKEFLPDA